MRLSLEKTSIVGMKNSWNRSDEEQKELQENISPGINDNNLKQVVLWGVHGTDKIVLGIEVAKIFMT